MKHHRIYIIIFLSAAGLLFNYSCTNRIFIRNFEAGENIYPMFGQNPQRNFYVPVNIGDSLKLLWEAGTNGSYSATSVTAVSNYIFVPDLSGRIYAFNINNGHEIGNIKYKGVVCSAPVIDDSHIIFPIAEKNDGNSSVYFYDFSQGNEMIRFKVDGKIQPEMIYQNNEVIYITEEGMVGKISYAMGKIWEYDTKSFLHSSPALIKNSIIFGNDKGEILSININSGMLNYRKTVGKGFEGGFTVSGDTVYAADIEGKVMALNANDGDIIWSQSSGTKINTTPVTDEKFMYLNNLKGEIFKLDKVTGRMIWKTSTKGLINTTPLVFNDYLLQPDLNKKIYFINKVDGRIARIMYYDNRVKLSPIFFNNTLIIGTDNGELYAYEPFKND